MRIQFPLSVTETWLPQYQLLEINLSFSLCLGHLCWESYGTSVWIPFLIPNSIPVVPVPLYSAAKHLVKFEIRENTTPRIIHFARDCLGCLFKVFLFFHVHRNIRVKNNTSLAIFVKWYIKELNFICVRCNVLTHPRHGVLTLPLSHSHLTGNAGYMARLAHITWVKIAKALAGWVRRAEYQPLCYFQLVLHSRNLITWPLYLHSATLSPGYTHLCLCVSTCSLFSFKYTSCRFYVYHIQSDDL